MVVRLAEVRILQLAYQQTCLHLVTRFYLKHVLYGTSLVLLCSFGYIINLQPIATTTVSKEHHGVVHGAGVSTDAICHSLKESC